MSANIPKPSIDENVSTSLSSGVTDVASSADVGDATKIGSPSYVVVGRVDSAGTLRDENLWEYWKVTNIAGNTLTITRAQGGSTAQAHSSGAIVEPVVTSSMFEDWYAVLNPEHDSAGGHVITGTMTVAGMNLASVASIASAGIGTARVVGSLNASGASISGIPLTPVFVFIGSLSGATVSPQSALPLPRSGKWQYANFVTRTTASGVSAIVDINLNGTSIFDAIGRPMIAAGGTFVSTASIKTPNFFRGDRLTWDYDGTGGHITDFNVLLVSE